jgi:uncharacterized membrane protein YfcA
MFFPNAEVVVDPALLVLLGVMAGTLSGFFGVGGGFLITGGLLVFGVPTIFAVGTGLSLIMGTSLINTLKHRDLGHVDFKLGLLMITGTIPAEILAERLNNALESAGVVGPVIRYTYVVILVVLGLFIVYDYLGTRQRTDQQKGEVSTLRLAQRIQSLRIPPHSIRIPGLRPVSTYVLLPVSEVERISVWVLIGVGFAVGFLAGLLGAGGGFILMPILVYGLGIPTTNAIGTDLFQIVITGSVGTFIYALSSHVDLLMVMIMLAAASVGAQLGSTATRFVEAARIRVLYGLTLLSGSVAVALKQAAETSANLDFLSTVAAFVLLSVSGAMCVTIAAFLVTAHRRKPAFGAFEETHRKARRGQ